MPRLASARPARRGLAGHDVDARRTSARASSRSRATSSPKSNASCTGAADAGRLTGATATAAPAIYTRARILGWLGERSLLDGGGGPNGGVAGLIKLAWSTLGQSFAEYAAEVDGLAAIAGDDMRSGQRLVGSRSYTIAGGTTEVMRNIIGERSLGLPREPRSSSTRRRGVLVAQQALQQLARLGAWHSPRNSTVRGHLYFARRAWKTRAAPRRARRRSDRRRFHDGDDDLAPVGVGHADHGHVGDGRMSSSAASTSAG